MKNTARSSPGRSSTRKSGAIRWLLLTSLLLSTANQQGEAVIATPNVELSTMGYDPLLTDVMERPDQATKGKIFTAQQRYSIYADDDEEDLLNYCMDEVEHANCSPSFTENVTHTYEEYKSLTAEAISFDTEEDETTPLGAAEFNFKDKAGYGNLNTPNADFLRDFFNQPEREVRLVKVKCVTHTIRIIPFYEPVFTTSFKAALHTLHETAKDTNSETRKKVFSQFVRSYGTHFARTTHFGYAAYFVKLFAGRAKTPAEEAVRSRCMMESARETLTPGARRGCETTGQHFSRVVAAKYGGEEVEEVVTETGSASVSGAGDCDLIAKESPRPVTYVLQKISALFKEPWITHQQLDCNPLLLNGTALTIYFEEQLGHYSQDIFEKAETLSRKQGSWRRFITPNSTEVVTGPSEAEDKNSTAGVTGPSEAEDKNSTEVVTGPSEAEDKNSTAVATGQPGDEDKTSTTVVTGQPGDEDKNSTTVVTGQPGDEDKTSTTVVTGQPGDEDKTSTTVVTVQPGDEDKTSTTVVTVQPEDEDETSTTVVTVQPEDEDETSTTVVTVQPGDEDETSTTVVTGQPEDEDKTSTTVVTVQPEDEDETSTTVVTVQPEDEDETSTTVVTVQPEDEDETSTTVVTVQPEDEDETSTTVVTVQPEDEDETSTTVVTVQPEDKTSSVVNGPIIIVGGLKAYGTPVTPFSTALFAPAPPPFPVAVAVNTLSRVGSKLYSCGGLDSRYNYYNKCWVMDTGTPNATWKSFNIEWGMVHHSAVVVQEEIWLFPYSKLRILQTRNGANTVRKIDQGFRLRFPLCAVTHGSQTFVIGAGDGREEVYTNNDYTKPEQWERFATLQQGRYDHACIVFAGEVIVTGGRSAAYALLSSVQAISVVDGTVRSLALLGGGRQGHQMAIIDGRPAVLGGWNGNAMASIEAFDGRKNAWETLSYSLGEPRYEFGLTQYFP